MIQLKPSEIRFSQDSISNKFDSNVYIGDTLDDLIKGHIRITDIPTISVKNVNGNWVSADNRRLWVFQHLEQFGKCETIQVIETGYIPPFKYSSTNDGLSVKIRGGGNPGGAAYPVYEKCTKGQNTDREELEKKLREIKMESSSMRDRIRQYEKYIKSYENTDKEQIAEIDSLTNELKDAHRLIRLLESQEIILENQESYKKLNTKKEMLEEEVKSLNTQLANSKQKYRKWKEACKNMKEKKDELESENKYIRNSQSAMEIKESKAKLQSMTMKLEDTEKKYSKLYGLYTSKINTLDELKKEIVTLKKENTKLKHEIHKKDNRMMDIRRLTYD